MSNFRPVWSFIFPLSMNQVSSIVQKFIQTHDLISQRDRILVAISGGPDSVFLAYCLHQIGISIGLAHVNYHLRGEDSQLDQQLVEAYAKEWGVPLHIHQANPQILAQEKQISLQVACRDIRYDFFGHIIEAHGYTACATAHHQDDQVESLLMSLLKGNSPSLMKGIPVRRSFYIRPLLCLGKQEILASLKEEKLAFRIDSSNLKTIYQRNQIRHEVLPSLETFQPSVRQQLLERYSWYQGQKQFLDQVLASLAPKAIQKKGDSILINLSECRSLYGASASAQLLAYILASWGYHGNYLWQIISLLEAQVGKKVIVEQGEFIRDREGIMFLQQTGKPSHDVLTVSLPEGSEPIQLEWHNHLLEFRIIHSFPADLSPQNIYYLDVASLYGSLQLRSWKQGDRMTPFGMKREKKLSDIFVDEKYDTASKRAAWVLCDEAGIICLSGFRISDRVRISPLSQTILVVEEYTVSSENQT